MPSPHWFLRFTTKIKSINLFKDVDKTDEEDIKNQKISTAIFLILLKLSIIALFLYILLTPVTKTVVIKQPSLSDYKQLAEKYPNTLICPCTSVSNQYNKFISSFTPNSNQICSSDFVTDTWLNYVNYRPFTEAKYHYYLDFRHSAYSFFYMLRTLCMLALNMINNDLIEFYSTVLLTENVILEDTFLANTHAAREQFITTSANDFVITLNLVVSIALMNNIYNRLEINWQPMIVPTPKTLRINPWINAWSERVYPSNGCSYSGMLYCSTSTGIYFRKYPNETTSDLQWGLYRAELQFEVAGVHVGPLILYAVLQSNLSCLYNKICLSELNTYLNDSLSPFSATPLTDPSSSNSSLPKVNDLVKQLMVDHWEMNSSYDYYFSACNPSTCSYTYVHQFDVISVITTVIAFIGGIITILMILILPIVTFSRKQIKRCYQLSSSSEVVSCETGPGEYFFD